MTQKVRLEVVRGFRGERTLRITARTLHIGAAAVVMGAVLFDGVAGHWTPILVFSGLLIMIDDLYKHGVIYVRTAQAWVIALKLGLLALAVPFPHLLPAALWSSIVLGSVISHAPGSVRYRVLWGAPSTG